MPDVTLHTYFITQDNPFLSGDRKRAAGKGGHVNTRAGNWGKILGYYYNEKRNNQTVLRTLPECLERVEQLGREPSIDDRKKSLPLFFLGELSGKEGVRRTKKNTDALWAIGVDLDGKTGKRPTFKDIVSFTDSLGYRAEVHTTAKHTPTSPRVRVLFLLGDPVPYGRAQAVWEHLVSLYDEEGWDRDPSTKDPSRGWYAPTSGSENYHQASIQGAHFDWETLTESPEDAILDGNTSEKVQRGRLKPNTTLYLEDGSLVSPDDLMETLLNGEKVKCYCPLLPVEEHNSCSSWMTNRKGTLYAHCGAMGHTPHLGQRLVLRYNGDGVTPEGAMPNSPKVPIDLLDMLSKKQNKHGSWVIKESVANLMTILEQDEDYMDELRYDEFTDRASYREEFFSDTTPTRIQRQLSQVYGKEWSYDKVGKAIACAAGEFPFDQRVEWLESLPQCKMTPAEAKKFIGTLATKGFGVREKPLYLIYTVRFMIGLIARALEPGCKHDTMLILTGAQGAKKSGAFRALMHNPDWFSDTPISLKDVKAAVERMQGVWLSEWAELSTMSSASFGEVKQFTASQQDKLRMAYGRYPKVILRRGCRCGTANADAVLHDLTGSRREWPMRTSATDLEWITKHRDELFAAALLLYKNGEQWWLTDNEDIARETDAENYRIASLLETHVLNYTREHKALRMGVLELVAEAAGVKPGKATRTKIGLILTTRKWSMRTRVIMGKNVKVWEAPDVTRGWYNKMGAMWDAPIAKSVDTPIVKVT